MLALASMLLAVRLAAPAPAVAPPPPSSAPPAGVVRSDAVTLDVLPGPPATGEIRTPEGFLRLEGGPAPERRPGARTGAFGAYAAQRGGAVAAAAALPAGAAAGDAGAAGPTSAAGSAGREPGPRADPCRAARSRYLARVLHLAGIDVADPLALLEGLAGPGGYPSALLLAGYGLPPGVDPVAPLAWDLELRSLARDLASCAR